MDTGMRCVLKEIPPTFSGSRMMASPGSIPISAQSTITRWVGANLLMSPVKFSGAVLPARKSTWTPPLEGFKDFSSSRTKTIPAESSPQSSEPMPRIATFAAPESLSLSCCFRFGVGFFFRFFLGGLWRFFIEDTYQFFGIKLRELEISGKFKRLFGARIHALSAVYAVAEP